MKMVGTSDSSWIAVDLRELADAMTVLRSPHRRRRRTPAPARALPVPPPPRPAG